MDMRFRTYLFHTLNFVHWMRVSTLDWSIMCKQIINDIDFIK